MATFLLYVDGEGFSGYEVIGCICVCMSGGEDSSFVNVFSSDDCLACYGNAKDEFKLRKNGV